MKRNIYLFILAALLGTLLEASTMSVYDPIDKQKVSALNDCVSFVNESIHGMLISHRLFENFNQKLNRYVDLEDEPLNFYSNADLPKNIFEDPENWFYETSPLSWYNKCVESTSVLGKEREKIIVHLKEMKAVISEVNSLRFTLENLLKKLESDDNALPIVYEKLETVSKLYNQFFVLRNHLEEVLTEEYDKLKIDHDEESFNKFYSAFIPLHRHYLNGTRHYRFKETSSLASINLKIDADLLKMPNSESLKYNISSNPAVSRPKQVLDRVFQKSERFIQNTNDFLSGVPEPKKYKLYGNHYYYHNIKILGDFNRYGNGIVSDFNSLIAMTGAPYLKFIEEPPIYKVIYPEKLEEGNVEQIESEIVSFIPNVLENRTIIKRKEVIEASGKYMDIEIYDHQKLDRDIVSINFNGKWILQDFTISDKPKRMRLQLNEDGVNYLVLHAENVGVIPPNTMALRYTIGGVKKLVVLNSDLQESELIEISF